MTAGRWASASEVRRIAVVGGGTIGASWALLFVAKGFDVIVYDTKPEQSEALRRYLDENWSVVIGLGLATVATPPPVAFTTDLAAAVVNADFVQENAPDLLEIKQDLYAALDRLTAAHVPIASSTSSLKVTDIQRGLRTAARCLVAHPFNPPHLLPLVEIGGGDETAPDVLEFATDFFRGLGKVVLRLHGEITGHVVNRLQGALFREAMWLVREGVTDVTGIDHGIAFGPGLRWAVFGPFMSFHLAAQDGGIRQYLDSLGASHQRIWDDLKHVEDIPQSLIAKIADGVDTEAAGASIKDLTAFRDARMVDIVKSAMAADIARDRAKI